MKTTRKTVDGRVPDTFEGLVGELVPSAIHDKVGHRNAMLMIDRLARVPRHSPGQLRYLETLSILVAAYEKKHYSVDPANVTPPEILKSFMADHAMGTGDLARLLGVSPALASRILKGDRNLTTSHIRKLADRFKVRADVFIG